MKDPLLSAPGQSSARRRRRRSVSASQRIRGRPAPCNGMCELSGLSECRTASKQRQQKRAWTTHHGRLQGKRSRVRTLLDHRPGSQPGTNWPHQGKHLVAASRSRIRMHGRQFPGPGERFEPPPGNFHTQTTRYIQRPCRHNRRARLRAQAPWALPAANKDTHYSKHAGAALWRASPAADAIHICLWKSIAWNYYREVHKLVNVPLNTQVNCSEISLSSSP